MGGSSDVQAGVQRPSGPRPAPEASVLSRVPLSVIALIASFGVLVSSYGYAIGRAASYPEPGQGIVVYWFGQVLILLPIAGRLLSRRSLSNSGIITLIGLLTTAEYLLKCAYSPLGFGFNDEFLHWRGTTDMLQSGKLFELNYGLPIGTNYPGLEEVTSALISVTGLSVFQAGLVVAAIAHLLYVLFLYMMFVAAIRSHRIAGIAILIYFSAPALTSFNSMFIYETLALAFFGMCIVAGLRSTVEKSPRVRRRWFAVAVLCIFATVITHHVTSYMLTAFLFLVAFASWYTKSRNTAKRFLILAVTSLLSIALWIATVARDTISYFSPTVQGITGSIANLINGGSSGSGGGSSVGGAPALNFAVEAVGLLLLTALIGVGSRQAWQRHRRHPWLMGMMIAATLGWVVSIGIRVGAADGQELAGRAATYLYIPVSVIVALALTWLVNSDWVRRWRGMVTGVMVVAVVGLMIDGFANGWPPFWERIPGVHQVAAFEAAVDPEEVNIGYWTLNELGPGNVFAADQGLFPVLIGYGEQNPQELVPPMYESDTWETPLKVNPDDPAVIPGEWTSTYAQQFGIDYVETDVRLTKSLPPTGSYFPDQPGAATTLDPGALDKYDHIEGIARVYSDGTITIYGIQSQGSVPDVQGQNGIPAPAGSNPSQTANS
jgi:hypothetical protein